ncbi:hypothetical protein F1559_004406 [Cyanidiococcus yangmingshanensis]|uniref:Uncharacterized protein n=1 Tax=Cyanidiococcus yangmingshanensis TaxID=2690220 RepID=A0A7J7INQ3_9RHOD|nr:hypothetical protein F1559_004406 [Cyanidiococcus yangmingshanensis]
MSTETALHTALLQFERLAIDWYALCTLVEAAETARRHVERGDFAPWWNARRITLTRAALRLSRQVAYTHTKSCGAALTSLEQSLLQTSNASLVAEYSRESFIKTAQRLERAPALPSALEGERVEDVPFQRSDVELDFATAEVAGLCLDLQQPYRAYVSLLSPREASQCSYLRFLRVLATLPQTTDLVSWLSSNPVAISADDQEWVETSREGAMQQPRKLPEKNILRAYANVLAFIHQYLVDFAWRAMPWLSPADWEQIRSVVVDDDCESETAA